MKLKIFEKQKALKKLDDGRRKERERESKKERVEQHRRELKRML